MSAATKDESTAQEQTVAASEEVRKPEDMPSRYTRNETRFIALLVAIAWFFSPFPANIYFPSIPTLTGIFHKSTSSLNLTVTVYLIFQGISPVVWGPVSDFYGRRPTYIICLSILVLSSLGLALVPTNAFWLLLLLRCVQSAGCSSTTALGAGTIGDITSRKDRGGYLFASNIGSQLAPVIGPVLGGALADGLGWRSIFWFLCILAGCCLSLIITFFPETRASVDTHRTKLTKLIYLPLIHVIGRSRRNIHTAPDLAVTSAPALASGPALATSAHKPPEAPKHTGIRNPLPLFLNPAVSLALTFTAIVYAVWYCVTATNSTAYAAKYPFLTETHVGLCYLPLGAGMLVSSLVQGRILDAQYRRMHDKWVARRELEAEKGAEAGKGASGGELEFPVERARLRLMPYQMAIFAATVIGWGWAVQAGVHLAVPLVLQLPMGYTYNSVLNTTTTLMIDIEHEQSSSVTACTNLARCSLAAILTAVIDYIIKAFGYGWTFVILGGVAALMIPLVYVEMIMGPRWRARRAAKKAIA